MLKKQLIVLPHFCKKFKIFLFFSLVFYVTPYAQVTKNYKKLDSNEQAKTASIVEVNNRHKTLLQNLPSEYKDKYKEIYKEIKTEKVKSIEKGLYLFNDTIQQYFNEIVAEIKRNNPSAPVSEIKFFVSRDYIPNAMTWPDGTMAFNLSLLANCKSESQLAFVICHEIAHYHLHHSARAMKKSFDKLYSKQAQDEMKQIARTRYDAYEKAEQYLKNVLYDTRQHSRDYEEQADSLAVVWMLNTRYNVKESAQCLLMLDVVDSLIFTPKFDLIKIFDTPQYKFKKSWIQEEETLFSNGKRVFDGELDKDSLKTHPSCIKRAKLVESFLNKNTQLTSVNNLQTDALFNEMKIRAEYETMIAAYDFDNVDYSLFMALNALQTYPDNVFLQASVGQNLNEIYSAQKLHTLSNIVNIPNSKTPKNYQPFLRFLNNMTLNEIAQVTYNYLNKLDKDYLNDEFFLFNMLTAAKNANQIEDFKNYKSMYLKAFPKGKYMETISKY